MYQTLLSMLPKSLVDFVIWYNGLTPQAFLYFYWPLIIIDLIRALGKTLFLPFHMLYKRLTGRYQYDDPEFHPRISIIIPAHNEEKIIVRAIETALETDYPDKEVLVIDDGSTDETYHLAYPYHRKGLIKLIRRDTASGSKAGALNYGILFAKGDIVVSVDADTMIERTSLKELIKPMKDPRISAVAGNIRIFSGEDGANNLLVKLQRYEYLINLELGRRFASLMGTLLIISGALGAFWKHYATSLGSYDSDTITEDFDITFKMRKLGKQIVFADKAIAWTFVPETWEAWKRQRLRWTRGQVETIWKHRNLFTERGFSWNYVVAVYDMVLIDIVILFIRTTWILVLLYFYTNTLLYVMSLMVFMYMIIEVYTLLVAVLISSDRSQFRQICLVPVMVLLYRPYYSLVRLKAYIDWILGREIGW